MDDDFDRYVGLLYILWHVADEVFLLGNDMTTKDRKEAYNDMSSSGMNTKEMAEFIIKFKRKD